MPCELTVILKDSERTYRKKFLTYDAFMMKEEDPFILDCIHDAKKDFQGQPEKVEVKTHMEIV